jgi:hypothetical protein
VRDVLGALQVPFALAQRPFAPSSLRDVEKDGGELPGSERHHADVVEAVEGGKVGFETGGRSGQRHAGKFRQVGRLGGSIDLGGELADGLRGRDPNIAIELGIHVQDTVIRRVAMAIANQLVQGHALDHVEVERSENLSAIELSQCLAVIRHSFSSRSRKKMRSAPFSRRECYQHLRRTVTAIGDSRR